MASKCPLSPPFARVLFLVLLLEIGSERNLAATEDKQEAVSILAAGDVANCKKSLRKRILNWFWGEDRHFGGLRTAEILARLPGTILAIGDLAYPDGSDASYRACLEPSWGRFRHRILPVPGNQEYASDGAEAYYDYWGTAAGERGRGYYSTDIGAWHVVALNSELEGLNLLVQEAWLREDLARTAARCILAYWHRPAFSSGSTGGANKMAATLHILYEAGTSVVLAAHDHNYERFAPLAPDGNVDPERGIRMFTVGTGGHSLERGEIRPQPNSEVFHNESWGLLKLDLYDDRYSWAFIAVEGHSFRDTGSDRCVQRPIHDPEPKPKQLGN